MMITVCVRLSLQKVRNSSFHVPSLWSNPSFAGDTFFFFFSSSVVSLLSPRQPACSTWCPDFSSVLNKQAALKKNPSCFISSSVSTHVRSSAEWITWHSELPGTCALRVAGWGCAVFWKKFETSSVFLQKDSVSYCSVIRLLLCQCSFVIKMYVWATFLHRVLMC